jgi:hypothetical protein
MEIGGSDSCGYGHNLLSKEKRHKYIFLPIALTSQLCDFWGTLHALAFLILEELYMGK